MSEHEADQDLEHLLHRALRELPLRAAPRTLESRVLGALERRAELSWWRCGFAHWPPAARATFLVICGALVGLAFPGGAAVVASVRSLHESGALSVSCIRAAEVLMTSAWNLAALFMHAAPPNWLNAGIAVFAALYAVLFGLGAAVYRTLYLQPLNGR